MKYLDIEDTLQNEALRIVHQLNPEDMEYDQWFGVGAALKGCGCAVKDWDDFSKLDPRRYHAGECERKWAGMRGTVIGALYALMRDMGVIDTGNELDWDDEILVGGVETPRLAKSHEESFLHLTDESKDETITQLGALFEEGELVCYVNRLTLRANGKYEPENKGHYGRTCAQLIRDLEASSDIGGALGDYTTEAGALVHVNPVNGGGVGNKYIVVFRHALVECDEGDLQSQLEKILELNLPCACVVFSGSRSIHAAVRVDAKDCGQYGERVEFLYDFCSKHGLKVDTGCKDPARMMRLAGATRKGVRQKLIATHVGCSSWDEWYGWATGSVMPEIVNLGSIWHRLPPLAPEMIEGTLRVGHKMLVAGPSKAGKSFLLIQLAVAVAEGSAWLGKSCRQGKVLYINLEVDAAS